MKKFLLILLGLFLLLIVAAVAIPFIYKDKIIAKTKEEINKTINAKVDFGDFDLTILSSFPNLTFSLNDLSVVGVNEFEGDTLTFMKSLELKLNIRDVIGGDQMKIKSIALDKPYINIIVLKDGKANYDIAKADSTVGSGGSESSSFKLALQSYSIDEGRISYDDRSLDFKMIMTNLNHKGKGDFTQDLFTLGTNTTADKTNLWYGGVKYLNNVKTKVVADLEMDMKNSKYTFKENELALNELVFGFDGWLAMPNDDINMDLKWNVKKNDFRNFISMIPAIYKQDIKDLKSSGRLDMNGYVRGTYNETSLPGYDLNLKISNGMFQYPSLPSAVNNVNIDLNVNCQDGVTDHTVINLKDMHIEMGSEPFDARLYVSTPISDPHMDAMVKGTVNLSNVKNYIPLETGTELSGIIKADVTMKGKYSSIEKKEYHKFNAAGNLSVADMNYKSKDYPPTLINNILLTFNPNNVTLSNFVAQTGKSDIKANGTIDNLLGYYFKDELLKGTFNLNSSLLDLNELMTGNATTSSSAPPDTSSLSVITLPTNVDFTLNTSIGKIFYDNLVIENLKGSVTLSNETLNMKNLAFNLIDGQVKMSGKYSTPNPAKPDFDYSLSLSNFDIQRTAKTFSTVKKLAPVTEKASGKFSAELNIAGKLDSHMQPVYSMLNGKGKLTTQSVTISNFEPLNKIADALKMDEYKQLLVQNANISFSIKDGRVFVDPFETNLAGANAKIQGSNGLDQTIEYSVNLAIPKSKIPGAAQATIGGALAKVNNLTGTNIQLPDPLKVNLLVGGTVTKPTVKTDFSASPKAITETVKEEIKEVIKEKVEDVKQKAREEADKLMAEAQKQAQQIRDAAKISADKVREEGYAQADNLVKQANNPIAKAAAQKGADKLKKETDAKAQKIIDEGNAKADAVLDAAKKKSDALLK